MPDTGSRAVNIVFSSSIDSSCKEELAKGFGPSADGHMHLHGALLFSQIEVL